MAKKKSKNSIKEGNLSQSGSHLVGPSLLLSVFEDLDKNPQSPCRILNVFLAAYGVLSIFTPKSKRTHPPLAWAAISLVENSHKTP